MPTPLTAGQRAARTRKRNYNALAPKEQEAVNAKRQEAAHKAWRTIKAKQKATKAKLSKAAKKAWATRRAKAKK